MRVLEHKDDTVAAQEHLGRVAVLAGKKCVLNGRVRRRVGRVVWGESEECGACKDTVPACSDDAGY